MNTTNYTEAELIALAEEWNREEMRLFGYMSQMSRERVEASKQETVEVELARAA